MTGSPPPEVRDSAYLWHRRYLFAVVLCTLVAVPVLLILL